VLLVVVAAAAGYLLHRRRRAARHNAEPALGDGDAAIVEMASNPMFRPNSSAEGNQGAGRARTATTDSAGYARPSQDQPMVYEMNKPLPELPAPITEAGSAAADGYLSVMGAATKPASADRGSLNIDRKTAEALVAAADVPGGFLLRRRGGGRAGKAAAAEEAVGDQVVSWMRDDERGELKATVGIRHDILRMDSSSGAWRHVSGAPGSEPGTLTGAMSLESAAIALLRRFGVRSPRFLLALQTKQEEGSAAVYEVVQREPVYDYGASGQQDDTSVPMHAVDGVSVPVGPYSIYDGGSVVGAPGRSREAQHCTARLPSAMRPTRSRPWTTPRIACCSQTTTQRTPSLWLAARG